MVDTALLGRAYAGDGFATTRVATLRVQSGRVVGCDPLTQPDRAAFVVDVPAGECPVALVVGGTGEFEAALLVFADTPPVRWAPATIAEDVDASWHAVDTGLAAFIDAGAAARWTAEIASNGDEVPDWVDDEDFDDNGYVSHVIAGDPDGHNIVIFRAGEGYGAYRTWIGYDDADRPVCLLTDFGLTEPPRPA